MKKIAWCYFCEKRVVYVYWRTFKRHYHRCPIVGHPVEMDIGKTRDKVKRWSENGKEVGK